MRNGWFSIFNFLCLVGVIHHHIICEPTSVFLKSVLTLVIPLFSLMAGYSWFSMTKRTKGAGAVYGLKVFVVPYLFWAVMYFLLNNVVLDVFVRGEAFSLPDVSRLLKMFVFGGVAVHLWFLAILIYSTLLSAIVFRFVPTKGLLIYNIIMLFIWLFIWRCHFINCEGTIGWKFKTYFAWFAVFFAIGGILSYWRQSSYTSRMMQCYVVPCLLLFGVVFMIVFTGKGAELILATAVYVAALSYPLRKYPTWLATSSSYGMGIYLIHAIPVAVVNCTASYFGVERIGSGWAWLISFILFFVCWLGVWVLRKVPLGANVV